MANIRFSSRKMPKVSIIHCIISNRINRWLRKKIGFRIDCVKVYKTSYNEGIEIRGIFNILRIILDEIKAIESDYSNGLVEKKDLRSMFRKQITSLNNNKKAMVEMINVAWDGIFEINHLLYRVNNSIRDKLIIKSREATGNKIFSLESTIDQWNYFSIPIQYILLGLPFENGIKYQNFWSEVTEKHESQLVYCWWCIGHICSNELVSDLSEILREYACVL